MFNPNQRPPQDAKRDADESHRNRYHILPIKVYRLVAIVGIVLLGVGSILATVGVACPYWNAASTVDWGPFLCLNIANNNMSTCNGILTFTDSSSSTLYTATKALTLITVLLGFAATGLVIYLFIRMRQKRLFDSLQRNLTIGALIGTFLAVLFGFTAVALVYYKIANAEGYTFSASTSACGIAFGAGCLLLCFGLVVVLLLILYRQLQEPHHQPQPQPQSQPQFKSMPRPDITPYQPRGPVPENPYGYTGDAIHDSQMHWFHQFYHHWAYNRPSFPFGPPANTVPTI